VPECWNAAGQTEAAVDYGQTSRPPSSGVICEIMNKDGTMGSGATTQSIARRHEIPLVAIADLIAYRA